MNNEIEKLEVKKILDNLEYVSDIHKVFIEDGYKIQEEIPSSQIKELRLNSYSAKLLFNHINNLQSKIDEANELLQNILVVNDWEHKGRYRPVKNTSAQDVYKTICKLYAILETPYRSDYGALKEEKIEEIPQFKGTMEQLDDLCEVKK